MSAKREIALNSLELLRRTELMRFIKLFGYLIMRTTLRLGLIQSTSYKHKHAWVRSSSVTKKKELQEDAKTLHNVSIVNERILPRIRRENSRPLYSKYKTGISESTGLTPLQPQESVHVFCDSMKQMLWISWFSVYNRSTVYCAVSILS